jgi:two-component system cell cycle sensor histidine kinase/response regulator CckA
MSDTDQTRTGDEHLRRLVDEAQDLIAQLKRSEARYQSLIQGAAYGIYRTNAQGRLIEVNPALAAMLGYDTTEELLAFGPTTRIFKEPRVRDHLIDTCRRTGRLDRVEVQWKRKNGTEVTVLLSARTVRNESGEIEEFQVMAEDVSEQRRLESQLRQAHKMEAVGQLAGGIAHDFNNLLTAILGYTELLLTRHPVSDVDHVDLQEIDKAGQRAAVLTRQLLAFGRRQVPVPEDVDLNRTLTDLEHMLRRLSREDIRLAWKPAAKPALLRIDASAVEQVILNLVLNARDALPAAGEIRIEIDHVQGSHDEVGAHPRLQPIEYVVLRVIDTGTGMTPEVRAHLFEPFFTTKTVGKGTGLGLASVYGIVQDSHGSIAVESEVGRGTTFTLYFPALTRPSERSTRIIATGAIARDHGSKPGTILLVEDEEAVRAVISAALRKHGYQVLEAATPLVATDIFLERSADIDLLLTDVVMPEMNGPSLAQRLIGLRPELHVLFISGYTDQAFGRDVNTPRMKYLSKPFSPALLVATVRELLTTAA